MSARAIGAWSFALALAGVPCGGIPAQASVAPETALTQHVGDLLPRDVELVDESGRGAPLSSFLGSVPLVLVFGYYRCPTLCTTLMEGVLLGLGASGLPAPAYRVLGVSIDPRENAADAAAKAAPYRAVHPGMQLDLLTGGEAQTKRLARAAGVSYGYDARYEQYSHPAAFVVVSPEGRISRYFPGVRFAPAEVRLALIEASQERIGSLSERIYLRCAHYDPATGRYNLAVMTAVRALCAVLVVLLGGWLWRRRTP